MPYPWTAMKAANDAIYATGREYHFDGKLLPSQIVTQDRPMLRVPVRLVVKTAAGETLDTAAAKASARWTKATDLRVEAERVVDGPGFTIRNQIWSEYDGLVWCRMTLEPHAKATVSAMDVEFPLTPEFTDVINTYDYSQRQTGKLPQEGFVSENRPIWLGNGDGGIQWFCETDGWFFLKDNKKMMNVERHPEGVTMRVAMIDVPTAFDKPHTIEFGFIATPVRPCAYRTWQDPQQWGFVGGPGPWYPQGQEFLRRRTIGATRNRVGGVYRRSRPSGRCG